MTHFTVTFAGRKPLEHDDVSFTVDAASRDAAIFLAACALCHTRAFHHGEWARETKESWSLQSVSSTERIEDLESRAHLTYAEQTELAMLNEAYRTRDV